MKKLLSLFLATSFVAIATPAFQGEGKFRIGDDEFEPPFVQLDNGQVIQIDDADSAEYRGRRTWCGRGFERVARWRWDAKKHRWDFAGYTCRKGRYDDNRWGRGGNGRGGRGGRGSGYDLRECH